MNKTIKLLAITIIIAMLMPFTMVNAATSRTEEIVERLKESAKSYDGTVKCEGGTIEIQTEVCRRDIPRDILTRTGERSVCPRIFPR